MKLQFLCVCLTVFWGCAHTLVPGTQIKDNEVNRQLLGVVTALKDAIEKVDTETLLNLVSKNYFEDMGTQNTDDDYGYHELKETYAPQFLANAKEVYLTFQLHDLYTEKNRAWVDLRYNTRARFEFKTGSMWDTHKDLNRLELVLEDGKWLITRGL